jgi:hypothetical protein
MDSTSPRVTNTKLENIHTLLQGIENGEIRVPIFQRGFIWKKPQTIELLSSMYEGYPIGSIILWNTSDKSILPKSDESIPFPISQPQYPITYLIDGVQRLSALYGALGYRIDQEQGTRFSIGFDLIERNFRGVNKRYPLTSHELLTSVLFSPTEFVETQAAFFKQENSDLLVERAMELHDVFASYQLPVVTIMQDRTLDDVFEIFFRLNTKGTRLKASQLDKPYQW